MKLPKYAINVIDTFRLGYVATVSVDGRPNVSPKGTFVVLDDETIAFGEIRSPQTMENLCHQPECEVNFVDPFARKGVRVRGQTQIFKRGSSEFAEIYPAWETLWGDLAHRLNAIVVIVVTQAKPLTTPPYDDGATEKEMIALYKSKYKEIYP